MLLAVYRLASHLGKTAAEIEQMGMDEFSHWMAYLHIDPEREAEDRRTAALMATITNMAGRSLPGKKQVKPEDFLGKNQPKAQTWQEQKAFFQSLGRRKRG
jgi:hypothetical protein